MEIPQRKEGLHVREIEGQTVILDSENERMHTLNETAAFVFEAIDGRHTVEEISEALRERFEVSAEIAAEDTRRLVQQFADLQLVV